MTALEIRTVRVVPGTRRCSICRTARRGPRVDAGGDLGLVHVRCFTAWDRAAEAFEAFLPPAVEGICA